MAGTADSGRRSGGDGGDGCGVCLFCACIGENDDDCINLLNAHKLHHRLCLIRLVLNKHFLQKSRIENETERKQKRQTKSRVNKLIKQNFCARFSIFALFNFSFSCIAHFHSLSLCLAQLMAEMREAFDPL